MSGGWHEPYDSYGYVDAGGVPRDRDGRDLRGPADAVCCDRCGQWLERAYGYADEVGCGQCGHVPLCEECYKLHEGETEIERQTVEHPPRAERTEGDDR